MTQYKNIILTFAADTAVSRFHEVDKIEDNHF